MRKVLVLLVFIALALIASGCTEAPMISATSGDYVDKIEVEWVWPGGDNYTLQRATTSCMPSADWVTVVNNQPVTEYTDTDVVAGKAYFYQVKTTGNWSWPAGGHTTGLPENDTESALYDLTYEWNRADQCIHQYTYVLHPDPAGELPIDETLDGDTGTLDLDMYLDTTYGLDAVAEFRFTGYSSACTKDKVMTGWQYAPVSVPAYDGKLRGYNEWVGEGWQLYYLDVENKESVGGHWYVGDGENIEYFDYTCTGLPTVGCTCFPEDEEMCCP